MFMWIAEAPLNPAPDSATACINTAASAMPSPLPPYSSGMAMPSQPASAIARWNSCGKPPSVVLFQPIIVAEALAQPRHRGADLLLLRGQCEGHVALRSRGNRLM